MEKSDRIRSCIYYAAALVFIAVIISVCYRVSVLLREPATIPSLSSPASSASSHSPFLSYYIFMAGIFVCSLVLLGEDILKIYRRRKSLHIRLELIILGVIALLFSFIKIWFHLFFPASKIYEIGLFAVFIVDGYTLEIPFMFAAVIFFVRGFYVQDESIEKKERTTYFTLGASAIILIVVINYGWIFIWYYLLPHHPIYIEIANGFLGAAMILICSLVLQGEDISKIYRRRKSLFIRRELIILGVIAFLISRGLVVFTYFATYDLMNSSFLYVIIESIISGGTLSMIYLYAVGMLFVRAFHVCQDSGGEIKKDF